MQYIAKLIFTRAIIKNIYSTFEKLRDLKAYEIRKMVNIMRVANFYRR